MRNSEFRQAPGDSPKARADGFDMKVQKQDGSGRRRAACGEVDVCLEGNLGLTRACWTVVLFVQSAASLRGVAGFQRKIGLRAAPTSSRRRTRVVCGAVFTISGFVAASSAIGFLASINRSHSSLDSDSVGSIISAPATISGNAVVYGWNP